MHLYILARFSFQTCGLADAKYSAGEPGQLEIKKSLNENTVALRAGRGGFYPLIYAVPTGAAEVN